MFQPTHKSIVQSTVTDVPYHKPIRKQGAADSIIQAPNKKSETIYGGYFHTKPTRRPSLREKYIK